MGDRLPHHPRAPPRRAAAHLRHDRRNEDDRLRTRPRPAQHTPDRAAATTSTGPPAPARPNRIPRTQAQHPQARRDHRSGAATPFAHPQRWIEAKAVAGVRRLARDPEMGREVRLSLRLHVDRVRMDQRGNRYRSLPRPVGRGDRDSWRRRASGLGPVFRLARRSADRHADGPTGVRSSLHEQRAAEGNAASRDQHRPAVATARGRGSEPIGAARAAGPSCTRSVRRTPRSLTKRPSGWLVAATGRVRGKCREHPEANARLRCPVEVTAASRPLARDSVRLRGDRRAPRPAGPAELRRQRDRTVYGFSRVEAIVRVRRSENRVP